MSLHAVWQLAFSFLPKQSVCVEPVDENLSTDAGLLVFRQWDEQQQLTEGFAQQLDDQRRDPDHSTLEMVRSRLCGILAGYEDQNDHDALRSDAIFKLLADRLPEDDDLASQPTLSRFENSITPKSLLRLEDWFIARCVNSFDQPPREVTLDIDVFDDPTHGAQQLTLFHGYYKQYQRAVVTNRPGARTLPEGAYDEYSERGESENRNKELKCERCADRLSDPRYMANGFRMFLHCLASNLLVSLRQKIANPPAEPCGSNYLDQDAVPAEARLGGDRRRPFNRRRREDPLGEGHACTWRMRLIKVAARIDVTARRVRVFLSSSWPFLDHFRTVGQAILRGS
jgi:hypothetical protein